MKRKVRQNPIYIATTISVYLGLVLVGASPQVLAQSNFSGDSQSRIFEFTSKTNSVLSKLKLRQEQDDERISNFPVPGVFPGVAIRWSIPKAIPGTAVVPFERLDANEKILTVSVLPRASI